LTACQGRARERWSQQRIRW